MSELAAGVAQATLTPEQEARLQSYALHGCQNGWVGVNPYDLAALLADRQEILTRLYRVITHDGIVHGCCWDAATLAVQSQVERHRAAPEVILRGQAAAARLVAVVEQALTHRDTIHAANPPTSGMLHASQRNWEAMRAAVEAWKGVVDAI